MTAEWRPDDWKELAPYNNTNGGAGYPDFEAGAYSAMLSALLKWLNEPCGNLNHAKKLAKGTVGITDIGWNQHPHRYLCPRCMAELKENKNG